MSKAAALDVVEYDYGLAVVDDGDELMTGKMVPSDDSEHALKFVPSGHRYSREINFGEGYICRRENRFIPRYWGWGRSDGILLDSHTGKPVQPIQQHTAEIVQFPGMADDRGHQLAEAAHEQRAFIG